jgi:hypothetical protein
VDDLEHDVADFEPDGGLPTTAISGSVMDRAAGIGEPHILRNARGMAEPSDAETEPALALRGWCCSSTSESKFDCGARARTRSLVTALTRVPASRDTRVEASLGQERMRSWSQARFI